VLHVITCKSESATQVCRRTEKVLASSGGTACPSELQQERTNVCRNLRCARWTVFRASGVRSAPAAWSVVVHWWTTGGGTQFPTGTTQHPRRMTLDDPS